MRQRFEQQLNLGTIPIQQVKFQGRVLKSRDELPPVLMALQALFVKAELNEKIFTLLEEKIQTKKTGRPGMDLWHILVLAVVRHTLHTNWDRLEDLANHHQLLRQLLGVATTGFSQETLQFNYQTIVDNVSLIDAELLYKINEIVMVYGQEFLRRKVEEPLRLKTDSYVLETNVHFPTDLNLLWDSLRKGLDMVRQLQQSQPVKGWRKLAAIYSKTKALYRQAAQQVFRSNGKNEQQKRQSVQAYLEQARWLEQRFAFLLTAPFQEPQALIVLASLATYVQYTNKFIDQIERRLLKGEVIPSTEKVYSIFEPHTEWLSKGKQNKRVELGHAILLTTDQHDLIVDYKVMEQRRDVNEVESLHQRLQEKFPATPVESHSFDKGFYSAANRQHLDDLPIEQVVLPKRGKLTKADKDREHHPDFIALRHQHSAIESNINRLEHHGLSRCMDKGLDHYKRTVGLSVLAYNLHVIGDHLLQVKRKDEHRKKTRQRLYAARAKAI